MRDDQLTPKEEEALRALPREQEPSGQLEERTIRGLRAHGILHPPIRRGFTLTPAWGMAAAAAVLLLIVGSFLVGQWTGSHRTAQVMLAMHDQDSLLLAREVQRTGSTYLAALSALIESSRQNPEGMDQGREVALATLHAAADQVLSLVPDDPVAGEILRAMHDSQEEQRPPAGEDVVHHVAWF